MNSRFHFRAAVSRGFTLIELMIAVAIVSILVTIAMASYTSSIRKSRRTEAKTTLLDLAGREEQYYSSNQSYNSSAAALGYAGSFPTVGSGYYTVGIAVSNPPGAPSSFKITATTAGPQAADTLCQQFIIDQTGNQTATGTAPNPSTYCWGQ